VKRSASSGRGEPPRRIVPAAGGGKQRGDGVVGGIRADDNYAEAFVWIHRIIDEYSVNERLSLQQLECSSASVG